MVPLQDDLFIVSTKTFDGGSVSIATLSRRMINTRMSDRYMQDMGTDCARTRGRGMVSARTLGQYEIA